MKCRMYAASEPLWDESHEAVSMEDTARANAAEQETMRQAECDLIAGAGVDPTRVQWLEWEVVGYEEAIWTIDTDKQTRDKLKEAGWMFADEEVEQAT